MAKISSGILLYRKRAGELQVLLVHMGGPFWAKKDAGSWSIPKGEVEDVLGEDSLATARREFAEELGSWPEATEFILLGEVKNKSGKKIVAWAGEGDWSGPLKSNSFTLEWPPKSGKLQEFPEVDKAEWFTLEEARTKILKAQQEFLDRLIEKIP
jgi:predicted NUDIX family NTP pyrophosphohydrolase